MAYEIEVQEEGKDWYLVPRRCADLDEARTLAKALIDLYAPEITLRFKKVETTHADD